jgi:hypothetical protein
VRVRVGRCLVSKPAETGFHCSNCGCDCPDDGCGCDCGCCVLYVFELAPRRT